MGVSREDFQDSSDIDETAAAMHDDVEDRLEGGDLSEDEAQDAHDEIDRVVYEMQDHSDHEPADVDDPRDVDNDHHG
jgi:hypothetical protein